MILDTEDCSDFVQCGGDPTGTWDIHYMCWDIPIGLPRPITSDAACAPGVRGKHDEISGTYVFEDEMLVIDAEITDITKFVADEACARALIGEAPSAANCASVAAALTNETYTASCTLEAATCACELTSEGESVNYALSYIQDGNFLVDGTGRALPFCVAEDGMKIRIESEEGPVFAVLVRK